MANRFIWNVKHLTTRAPSRKPELSTKLLAVFFPRILLLNWPNLKYARVQIKSLAMNPCSTALHVAYRLFLRVKRKFKPKKYSPHPNGFLKQPLSLVISPFPWILSTETCDWITWDAQRHSWVGREGSTRQLPGSDNGTNALTRETTGAKFYELMTRKN